MQKNVCTSRLINNFKCFQHYNNIDADVNYDKMHVLLKENVVI